MLVLVLASVLSCGDLCSADAMAHYEGLLREGGYGQLPTERAAFLIRESDGGISMEPWHHSGFQRATFRGSIPPRTIAIAHTHPKASPNPSAGDRELARRVGLPVLVITPAGVVAAMPDGSVSRVVRMPVRASENDRAPRARRISLPR